MSDAAAAPVLPKAQTATSVKSTKDTKETQDSPKKPEGESVQQDDDSPTLEPKRVTPRPTYISSSDDSMEAKLPQKLLHRNSSIDLDDYFVGPRSLDRHSKWPVFLRLHGSVIPRMIIPMCAIACWSTLISCICVFVYDIAIDSTLLIVLGFVVGLALSLRSSTAYERYAEGRKYWATLMQTSRTLTRVIWIHNKEREGEEGKEDILAKLTGINLILAFAIALKHKLRFEPDCGYDDLSELIQHLDTFAKEAHNGCATDSKKTGTMKALGQYLSVPMAMSNPRKAIKRSDKPIGNLPVEILSYLSAYIDDVITENKIALPAYQSQASACLATMEEVMTGTERVLNTPLPLAYTILFSQITWIYVLALPFQLHKELGWVTIPGTIIATYIIHGISSICAEIENPFGHDVNDLPLETFCQQLAADLDIITSSPAPNPKSLFRRKDNMVLYPLSRGSASLWNNRSVDDIRAALKAKATIAPAAMTNSSRERVLSHKGEMGEKAC